MALIQTIRLRELKRRTNADVWLTIGYTASLLRNLEDSGKLLKENSDLTKAYKGAADLYKQLLKHAILDERNFTEATIKKWRSTGRLLTNWQVLQARLFVETSSINLEAKESQGLDSASA